ncbi:MAG TPA: SRPBCC family protein [Baekduia sp.]|nr:SRPBCC family protein [Baekduia sp.]
MALTEIDVDVSPERCFEVLSDPRSYAYWVVGSREVRAADANWPAPGSRFHHTVEPGVEDHTVVEEVEPNRRLRLRARFRPLGTAFVTLTMQPRGGGCRLRLEEEPADRLSRLMFNPLADRLLHHRNVAAIERLKRLVEGTVPIPTDGRDPKAAGRTSTLRRGSVAALTGVFAILAYVAFTRIKA